MGASASNVSDVTAIAWKKMAEGPNEYAAKEKVIDRKGVTKKHEWNNWSNTSGQVEQFDWLVVRLELNPERKSAMKIPMKIPTERLGIE